MENYDVIIIGAGTSGSYFGSKLAEKGFKVLIIDKLSEEKIGTKYDIFHIVKKDFERFNLPYPEKGNDYAFEFSDNATYSAFGNYPKKGRNYVIGMHLHLYTLRLNHWAQAKGCVLKYNASFKDFIFKNRKIAGIKYQENGNEIAVFGKLIADCSGIASVARTHLPDDYGVENFIIKKEEMFYVILRYVRYLDESDYLNGSRSWPYYKTWEAPQPDPAGAILGIGANLSFGFAEKIYKEFETKIQLPQYKLQHKEKGVTPYRRPPYSFVADNFIVMGDAACLTKPHAGEGITSSMVQIDIASEVVENLLKENKELTKENLWPINKKYIEAQGKTYAGMLATLVGAVSTTPKENDFFFKHDIIFSTKSFALMAADQELKFSFKEILRIAFKLLGGVFSGKVKIRTIRSLLKAMKNGTRISKHYHKFPSDPADFPLWVKHAEKIWISCGSMAESLNKIN